jgi:hypothetical protein
MCQPQVGMIEASSVGSWTRYTAILQAGGAEGNPKRQQGR